MDRPAWTQDDPVTRIELALTQETAQTPERGIGDQDALANDTTVVLTAKNKSSRGAGHYPAAPKILPIE
jgi:hypothetical protein